MVSLDISEVLPAFPEFRVALVVARDLNPETPVAPESRVRPSLDRAIAEVEAEVITWLSGRALAEIPELALWRAAYRAFGVKKTSYRSSVERLLKQLQQGRGLPRISALVDCYNALSARHRLPIGADDLDRVSGDLAFRIARGDDDFFALGAASRTDDPPKAGEVVYADGEKLLCRRWNWYQDARSATWPGTRRAVLTVQWLGGGLLEPVVEDLCTWLSDHCGARAAWAVAEARRPRAEVDP